MSSFYERAERLFEEVVTRPVGERDEFLVRACAGDEELLARIRTLLTADARDDDPLPPIEITELESEWSGQQIGDYRLIEPLGEGGFGTVWAAEQSHPVRRRVALKILRPHMDTREILARFEAERQSLAMMDHPGIAKVYDAGTTDRGRPYFVMEYVDGRPLTAYCDDRRLDLHERLSLLRETCAAVQHAHAKGVVHRDLKPSNILVCEVDGRPSIRIIDFGIAKAITHERAERTALTEVGRLVGTPEYMSPEQATLDGVDADTRTDVYSLGIVLYELLTGTVPVSSPGSDDSSYERTLRMIRETDPPRPSDRVDALGSRAESIASHRGSSSRVLARRLRGDLDWIVLKALERDRERRYETPMELARDLERHQGQEPIEARPPSVSYRFGKFVRRHRTGAAVVSSLVVGLAIAGATVTYAWIDGQRQRARVEAALREAEAVGEFLTEMLVSANVHETGDPDLTVREVLDRSAESLGSRFDELPEVEARIQSTLGAVYQGLGLEERALEHARRGYELSRARLGRDDSRLYSSAGVLANVHLDLGNYARAESLLVDSRDNLERLLGPTHRQTLTQLNNQGVLLLQVERHDEARQVFEELLERSRLADPPNVDAELDAIGALALLATYAGDHERAGSYYSEELERSLALRPADHPDVLSAKSNLALHYTDVGRWDEAIALLREVMDGRRRVLGDTHPMTLECFMNLGAVLGAVGLYDEAIEHYQSMDQATLDTLGPDARIRHFLLSNLGYAYLRMRRYEEAERTLSEALEIRRRSLGAEALSTLVVENNLGLLLMEQERWVEARSLMEGNLARRSAALGPNHPHTFIARRNLAQLRGRAGDFPRALEELEQLIDDVSAQLGEEDEQVFTARAVLGEVLLRAGDLDGARRGLDGAAPLLDRLQPRAPFRLDLLRWQIELCRRQGREDDRRRWESQLSGS